MLSPRLKADDLEFDGISHGFFTREGGVSAGKFASLNCGFGSGDETENVARNRAIVAETLGCGRDGAVMTPHQHHSADVAVVTEAYRHDEAPKADAVVTTVPKLTIGVLSADCAPVLFADPVAKIVGAAHAGWRGAVGGVLAATVAEMGRLGAEPGRMTAVVGPAIGQRNYEVGPEFRDEFLSLDQGFERFFVQYEAGGRPHFDLAGFAVSRLEAAGVGHVAALPHCTYENESLFFSYRRNCHRSIDDYGRQISAICIN